MPIWERMQIFYKSKGSHENQPCAKLPEKLFSKNGFFKMARKRAHEVRTAITSNLPVVSRSDLFSEYDSC